VRPRREPALIAAALLLAAALGADHYDPSTIAAASQRFAESSAASAPAFSAAQRRAAVVAEGVVAWEVGLDLLGERAPAAERAAFLEVWRSFSREKAVLQQSAQARADAYEAAFQDAVRRALISIGAADATACSAAPSGPRLLPGFGGGSAAACPGADRSAEVAAAVDRDPALAKALTRIAAEPWPTLTVPDAPSPPIEGDAKRAVAIERLVAAKAPTALQRIAEQDEADRLPIYAALEEGASIEEQRGFLELARSITARTAERRAALTADLLAAWAKQRDAGKTDLGWCARPATLGGCGLPTVEPDALPASWLKTLDKAEQAAGR
jgi:hypothetical protein